MQSNKLVPMLKWAGGKSQELPIIKCYMPKIFEDYYEPFLGGGAVWFSISEKEHRCFVNDYSEELIYFYQFVKNKNKNKKFFGFVKEFVCAFENIENYLSDNINIYKKLYKRYRNNKITDLNLEKVITKHIYNNIDALLLFNNKDQLIVEYVKNIKNKFKRTKNNELKKGRIPEKDISKNIETGFKASVYMFVRNLYNQERKLKENKEFWIALYFIIRNYSYSGMFRYNKNGDFNVPYGGIAYNSKNLTVKLNYYVEKNLQDHLQGSKIVQGDFEAFMVKKFVPQKNDFIFLDPPYDTEFNSYEGNVFEKTEQKRLASYLLNNCKSKWMLVIKHTDFIYNLYDKDGIDMVFFDKKYAVSFMGRNDPNTQHILIKNY